MNALVTAKNAVMENVFLALAKIVLVPIVTVVNLNL